LIGKCFVSPLLVQELFRRELVPDSTGTVLDRSAAVQSKSAVAQQIIIAGLLEESNYRWGVCCGAEAASVVVVTEARVGQSEASPRLTSW